MELLRDFKNISKNDVKESLTELLNIEFSDLLNGKPDNGYPQHQKMRAEIKKLWLDRKDVKTVVNDILEDERFTERV